MEYAFGAEVTKVALTKQRISIMNEEGKVVKEDVPMVTVTLQYCHERAREIAAKMTNFAGRNVAITMDGPVQGSLL